MNLSLKKEDVQKVLRELLRDKTHEPRGTGEALEKGDVAGVPGNQRKVSTQ